jgi:hypothetical protein
MFEGNSGSKKAEGENIEANVCAPSQRLVCPFLVLRLHFCLLESISLSLYCLQDGIYTPLFTESNKPDSYATYIKNFITRGDRIIF